MKNYFNFFKTSCVSTAFALISFSQAAQAAAVCTGTVASLGIGNTGLLMVSVGGLDHTVLCSVSEALQGVSVEACKVTYANLLSFQVSKKSVDLYFGYGDSATPCTDRSYFKNWEFAKKPFYYMETRN